MNSFLFEQIDKATDAILVTVLSTEGHSYKKQGDKALYVAGEPLPVYGNLGTTCVDPHIIKAGELARRNGKPTRISVDTTDPTDIHLGTGTYCGGRVDLLIEPILQTHKKIYRRARARLADDEEVTIAHDMSTGEINLTGPTNESNADTYVETLRPASRLSIFGATPLARHIVRLLDDTDFSIHVSDWRAGYLSSLADLPRVTFHLDEWAVDAETYALVMSHSYERDLGSLRVAMAEGCRFVGLLSSRARRERMFAELTSEGISSDALKNVMSPVGLPIHGRSDAEIALSIVAQLVEVKNR